MLVWVRQLFLVHLPCEYFCQLFLLPLPNSPNIIERLYIEDEWKLKNKVAKVWDKSATWAKQTGPYQTIQVLRACVVV